jgi:CIC family chloride channel protein
MSQPEPPTPQTAAPASHLQIIALGLLAGLVAVGFHAALNGAEALRGWLAMYVDESPLLGWPALLLVTLAAVLLAVALVRHFAPEASGSGISQVEGLMLRERPFRWLRVLWVKFASGVLGIGAGLALGREGPTVQMGAALGEMLALPARLPLEQRRQMIALGAAAGLTGAFNAPLAGVLFLFEELRPPFRPALCFAALLATGGADGLCRLLWGQRPDLGRLHLATPAPDDLIWFALLGAVAGLLGVVFNRCLLAAMRLARWLARRRLAWVLPVICAIAVAILGRYQPDWVGSGGELIKTLLLGGQMTALVAVAILLARFPLTIVCYAGGPAGGLFAPLLVMGASLGLLLGQHFPSGVAVEAFAVAGMTALFTGIVRAPLTGVLLMIEMAGAYRLILALIVAALLAKWTADALGDTPVYEALRQLSEEEER